MADNSLPGKEWQVPSAITSTDDRKLAWINSSCEEGASWLKSQRGTTDWKAALDTVAGLSNKQEIEYRSKIRSGHLKRNMREVVGTLSKLRPLWGYNSDNEAYKPYAEMMNKVTRSLYLEQFMDVSIKEALQYAAVTCSGWIRPIFRRNMAGMGHGEISLLSYGAPCVLPVQLPASGNFQQAYSVTILDEMPVYMAHAMFPLYQDRLKPTSSLYWYSNVIRQSAVRNMFRRIWPMGGSSSENSNGLSNYLVPLRYTYVVDLAINRTGDVRNPVTRGKGIEIPMGEPGTSWAYTVPYVGMPLPGGRVANETDARIYPYRRLIISSEDCVCYDGPSFDWHGMLPLAQFTTDKWPWEPIGFSMTRDGSSLQDGIDSLQRGIMDKLIAQNDPAMGYDINTVTKQEADQFDPMQPRARAGYDGSTVDAPFKMIVPPEVLFIRPELIAFIDKLKEEMDDQMGVRDMLALAKARMAGDDVEKLLEAQGPIVEEQSRAMEPPMRDIGTMVKYLVLQYMNTSRIMQYVGMDGVVRGTFDYDPASLVPSHMPGEDPGDAVKPVASVYSRIERARTFADNLRFFITPNSLHELTQMTYKLGLIQLKKAGVAIDSQTIAESWAIPNYGTIGGNTVLDRWKAEQELQLEFAARLKALGAAADGTDAAALAGMIPPEMMQGPTPPPTDMPNPGQPPVQEGRPPTGHAAPKLVSKDGGLRSTITES